MKTINKSFEWRFKEYVSLAALKGIGSHVESEQFVASQGSIKDLSLLGFRIYPNNFRSTLGTPPKFFPLPVIYPRIILAPSSSFRNGSLNFSFEKSV